MQANQPKEQAFPKERDIFGCLRDWAKENGGFIHPSLHFVPTEDGSKVVALSEIPPHSPVLTCPFSLAITSESSSKAFKSWLKRVNESLDSKSLEQLTQDWTERMYICSYIVIHWIAKDTGSVASSPELQHLPYLETLPRAQLLTTPLTFSDEELDLLKGTNLYGATTDRKRDIIEQHSRCQAALTTLAPNLADHFTFERYQTAAIYISSRSFPSILLSPNPSLTSSAGVPSQPVLLPLLDSLNHERNTLVTWMVDRLGNHQNKNLLPDPNSGADELAVSVVVGSPVRAGQEVLNNYGPKPNSELVLGYGFAIPNNPDDTAILQLGGSATKWEIGRKGRPGTMEALDGIFQEAFQRLLESWKLDIKEELGPEWNEDHEDEEFEVDMAYMRKDAAELLLAASQSRLEALINARDKLSKVSSGSNPSIRTEVARMLRFYLEGEVTISEEVAEYLNTRLASARGELREMDVLEEDSEEDGSS